MTEKEKMLSGILYDANEKSLVNDRLNCKDICFKYNQLMPSNLIEREDIIKELFKNVKENFNIISPFYCDYGYNIEIGKNFFMNHNCVILDCTKVIFGDNVLVGPDCGFYTASHPDDKDIRNKGLETAHPIIIGNDVWIGGGVRILPNVTIGSNVVIGAGSVVTKDIPSNTIACGNPCKVIKKIE